MAEAARRGKKESGRRAEGGAAGPRAFWSGTLTFALVSVPVDLFPANRAARTSLRTLGPEGTPLARRYYEPETGDEVAAGDAQRGFEVEPGRYVVVEDEELEALAPEKSRDIELSLFVPEAEVDPLFFERAYFLTPGGDSTRAYRLLAAVMEEAGRAGIATFVMRGKEYLVAILAEGGILRAETLRFADEVRAPETVGLPEVETPKPAAVRRMAKAIAGLHEEELDPGELVDEEGRRLLRLVEEKLERGEDVVEAEPGPEQAASADRVVDLMEVLKRSLGEAGERGARGGRGGKRAGAGRRKAGPALGEATKQELYERARELEIEGRSGMTKEELIRALRRVA